jgi:AAA domain, putative AbiEii toxin, Type IV TA system
MRKLTVKNFSVIKDAELEFGKITVLIGPQSSGKSLLCKLAYFFQVVVPELAAESIRKAHSSETFGLSLADQFVNGWFPMFGPEPHGEVHYEDGKQYRVSFNYSNVGTFSKGVTNSIAQFSPEIMSIYEGVRRRSGIIGKESGSHSDINDQAREVAEALRNIQDTDNEVYSYIPSTRSFFVTLQKALLGTSARNDPFTVRFSNDFNLDFDKRVPRQGRQHELNSWISAESRRILSGEVQDIGNFQVFKSADGREIALSFLSSGTQELLPLLTCLREFIAVSAAVAETLDFKQALHRRLFFVEEPEASIFPASQYDLVCIFSRMANEPILDASWVITTHSPYLLTAFNDLIKAGQVAKERPEKATEVEQIIPREYWIKPGDFAAYAFDGKDGILRSIIDQDTGLINGDTLDDVSDRIGGEFDELLDLQYGK